MLVLVTYSEFDFILAAFPTERWELQLVARKFERRGLIAYKEFHSAMKSVSTLLLIFFSTELDTLPLMNQNNTMTVDSSHACPF